DRYLGEIIDTRIRDYDVDGYNGKLGKLWGEKLDSLGVDYVKEENKYSTEDVFLLKGVVFLGEIKDITLVVGNNIGESLIMFLIKLLEEEGLSLRDRFEVNSRINGVRKELKMGVTVRYNYLEKEGEPLVASVNYWEGGEDITVEQYIEEGFEVEVYVEDEEGNFVEEIQYVNPLTSHTIRGRMYVCKKCGGVSVEDRKDKGEKCGMCGGKFKEEISWEEIGYE